MRTVFLVGFFIVAKAINSRAVEREVPAFVVLFIICASMDVAEFISNFGG